MASRIPARDALAAFCPKGEAWHPTITAETELATASRWYPQADGIRVECPYRGEGFDPAFFTLIPNGWAFEECNGCIDGASETAIIPAMTLCYVTRHDPYMLLCEPCYQRHVVQDATLGYRAFLRNIFKKS